jgi:CHAT domain-containing protein/Tfp pilus assembly protein PilF
VHLIRLLLLIAGMALPGPAPDLPVLGLASPVEQTIAAGETRRIAVPVEAGRFLRLVVEQRGIDLVVGLTDPAGSRLTEVNNPADTRVHETIAFVSDLSGRYLIDVAALSSGAPSGSCLVRLEELRGELPSDRPRIAAERAEAAADRLADQRSAESLRQAFERYATALGLWRRLGDPGKRDKEGEMLYRLGVVHRLLGESREALQSFNEALALQRRDGNQRAEAMTLNQMGLCHWALSENEPARAALEGALSLWRVFGEPALEARVLNNLGVLHRSTGRLREAAEAYRQALDAFHRSADRIREATALNNLGEVHRVLGEPLEALAMHERALALARSAADRAGEAESLNNLGLLQSQLGEAQKALEHFTAAGAIYRELGDRAREAAALNNQSSQYADLGEAERALDLLLQALPLQRQTGDRRGEAATLHNLGRSYSRLDRPDEALASFEQALEIQRATGDVAGEAETLGSLGQHETAARPARALEILTRSLALMARLGNRGGEARAWHRLGLAQSALGETADAVLSFERALDLFRGVADPAGEAVALQEIARIELARGEPEAARSRLETVLALIESLRSRVSADRLRAAYFSSLRGAYELQIETLMVLHRRDPSAGFAARAFETAERARARSLLDLLREARIEIRRGADPGLLNDANRFRIELNAKADALTRLLDGKHTEEEAVLARRELETAVAAHELAEARLRSALPAYANLVRPEPVSLPALQTLLDAETVLLEYSLGEARSFLWRVTPSSLSVFELPGRKEIEGVAREAHDSLSRTDPRQGPRRREILARAGRMLLGPAAGDLRGTRLAIVAGGALQYLPFAALPLPSGDPLVAHYEVVSLPSASVLGELRAKSASRMPVRGALAVLADPVFTADDLRVGRTGPEAGGRSAAGEPEAWRADLERAARDLGSVASGGFPRLSWSRREAEMAAAEAGEEPILLALDFAADLKTATGPDLARFRVVHFATHGILDSRSPELSGLVLSLVDEKGTPRNGLLRLPDIYNLDLGADLIVLSGCQTALGREIRGEGLMGLTRGFFHAGARQVMASVWPVRDRATAELMQRFYRALFREKLSPAAALRAAQLSMRQDSRWRDPYFWAAFVVQGDWAAPAPQP